MRALHVGTRLASAAAYGVLLVAMMFEKAGQTTSDTKAALLDAPGELLRSTFSLWNPQTSLGELQNQAYGYLFPMGPFFAGLQAVHVPAWVTERLWSWLVVVVACEGARLVCRQLGIGAWPAVVAGLAYGLNARVISEIGVRSAEMLPEAVLPWVLLPVLWVLRGRVTPRVGALLSAAAFAFSGAVNGTATVGGLPLVVITIWWGCRSGLARWSLLGWWSGCTALVSAWWVFSLLELNSYSPRFFDYVEDSRNTTATTGFDAGLRGASNWVGYLTTGAEKTWPAAWTLDYNPVLVVTTALVVAMSLVGLANFRSPWRTPFVVSAALGLVCLTVGHTSSTWIQSPLAPAVQSVLDHPLALLRNVSKADPMMRLPLAVGFGVALGQLAALAVRLRDSRHRVRPGLVRVAAAGACLLVVVAAQPVLALNLRTPGWKSLPSYWSQAADFLAQQRGQNAAWVVPGSGFGIQTWGWTMDEPMSMVAHSPWVTRSQVPLVPPETIRMLSNLEDVLDTGSGSAELGAMLHRLGLGFVLLRHDLDPELGDPPPSSVVSIALARSSGIRRVATFGALDFGPAIEVFEVTSRSRTTGGDLTVASAASARTVSSGPADVLNAVGSSLVGEEDATIVAGDSGWTRKAQVVGDGYQMRVRQFGRVHAAEGAVLARGQPRHAVRRVENYPGSPGARPVVARYHGIRYVDASTSQAYPQSLGQIRPETAPFAAVDGDPKTGWTTAFPSRPLGQWLSVRYDGTQRFGEVDIQSDADPSGDGVLRWQVSAAGRSVTARVDPSTGRATANLQGARGKSLRIRVAAVGKNTRTQVSIREISATGLPVERSLVVPPVHTVAPTAYLFRSTPESRPCVPTLVAPDCDPYRYRPAEESAGIDREVTLDRAGTFSVTGTVVARADPATQTLLDPFGGAVTMHASSTYFDDPTVSARMAYDGTPTTSWIASPGDTSPTLVVDFEKPRRIDHIAVAAPSAPGVAPASATLVAGHRTRVVDLGGFGTFKRLVTRHVEVTFHNPTRNGRPIGVGDLRLGPAATAIPLDGAATTGAFCGFGPEVYVDGRRHPTRVDGLVGDVASSGPLSFSLCGEPVRISGGPHRVRVASTPQFQPVRVVLAEPGAFVDSSAATRPSRSLRLLEQTATTRRAEVGPGNEALLVTRGNWNRGWTASLDGKTLQPQRIDGWAQGWLIPAGAGGRVSIRYSPQRTYLIGLVGGAVVAGGLMLVALFVAIRTRPAPGAEPRVVVRSRGRRRSAGRLPRVVLPVAAWIFAGLPGLAGVLIALLPGARRYKVVGAGLLVAAGALVTAGTFIAHGRGFPPDVADVLAGTGAVLALGVGLVGVRDERA
ncbi:alpha-(1-_3)-arabinofuranosyltransferase domain-containing protein [Marmoricola sp. URHA0025 HA25]